MQTLWQDVKYGARMLWKYPGITLIAVITLALGIGANTAIFSVVNGVLLRPLPFDKPEQLVMPWGGQEQSDAIQVVSYPDFADWRQQTQTLSSVAAYTSAGILFYATEDPELLSGTSVSSDLFPMMDIKPVLGRPFTEEDDKAGSAPVMVISYDLWQRRFNSDRDIIGKQIKTGGQSTTIIGVLPPGFRFPVQSRKTDFLRPLAPNIGERTTMRSSYSLRVVARLKKGVTREQASAEMRTIGQRLEQQYPDEGLRLGIQLTSLLEATVGSFRLSLLVLLGAVGLVLLIACVNIANLLLARASSREKEMAVRAALGASRLRIIRQLMTENLLISLLGGALGLALAVWGIDLLIAATPINIPRLRDVGLDENVLGFTGIISIFTGIIFGVGPVLRVSKIGLNESLKESSRGATDSLKRNRMRSLLVVSEVALSLILLIGAGLLIKSFLQLRDVNPGFEPQNVLVTGLSLSRVKYPTVEKQQAAFQEIVQRTQTLPGVTSVGLIDLLPLSGDSSSSTFFIEGRPVPTAEEKPKSNIRVISPDYFSAMGIPLLKGRAFIAQDIKTSPPVIVINETFAHRFFPDENPIGKRVAIETDPSVEPNPPARSIIGVVKDVRHESLEEESGPELYLPFNQSPSRSMYLVVHTATDNPTGMIMSVRSAIKQVDKEQYISDIQPMNQFLTDSVARRRFNTLLLGIFALVALIMASIGIYGVMSYSVTQRTHEIGIRMALGARVSDVFKLVVGNGMTLVLIGVVIGMSAAFAVTRVMSKLLFGVSATDPLTFIGVPLLLIIIAFISCLIPARKAMKVDPMIALRDE